MKHKSFGFTLVEITLFLAVTGALFVSIMVGTQNSIRAQRYNDSVQSFANFWRDIYASVSNTQNLGDGRSGQAIYGKLVVFGETYDLNGAVISNSEQKIFYYDVIGDVIKSGSSINNNALSALAELKTNVLEIKKDGNTAEFYPSGFADSYTPTWGASIEKTKTLYANDTWSFTGSILVVKHPRSTTIGTYYSKEPIEVNAFLTGHDNNSEKAETLLSSVLSSTDVDAFEPKQIDFCVNSDDIGQNRSRRQDVRLVKNANNVSGVEIIASGSLNDKCSYSEGGS